MSNETPNPTDQPRQTAPGKPGSRQPPDANTGQIPKTGRDPSEPIEEDVENDIPTDDDDSDEDDETGNIELPGEDGQGDRRDVSRPAGNP